MRDVSFLHCLFAFQIVLTVITDEYKKMMMKGLRESISLPARFSAVFNVWIRTSLQLKSARELLVLVLFESSL